MILSGQEFSLVLDQTDPKDKDELNSTLIVILTIGVKNLQFYFF